MIEDTKLGRILQGIHHNIVRFEEEKLAHYLDINRLVASGYAIDTLEDKRSSGACNRYAFGNRQ